MASNFDFIFNIGSAVAKQLNGQHVRYTNNSNNSPSKLKIIEVMNKCLVIKIKTKTAISIEAESKVETK